MDSRALASETNTTLRDMVDRKKGGDLGPGRYRPAGVLPPSPGAKP